MITKHLRNTALSLLRGSGAFTAVADSERRRDKLLILCYHGISLRDEHQWLSDLYVTPVLFRQRMEILKTFSANVIPLSEGIARLRKRSLPPRSVVITFDDGFCDFYQHAVPILRSFDYPCALYLTTHYCEHRLPIFNLVVNYMLWKSGIAMVELPAVGIERPMSVQTPTERAKFVQDLVDRIHGFTTKDKDGVARELAAQLGIDYDELSRDRLLQIMSPEEVAATAKTGVEIELHTHRHRMPRNRELFQQEIRENRTRIKDITDRDSVHFCYPSGEYGAEFLPWLRQLGVESATTCERRLASAGSEMLLLPRFLDGESIDALNFESWLCGLRV